MSRTFRCTLITAGLLFGGCDFPPLAPAVPAVDVPGAGAGSATSMTVNPFPGFIPLPGVTPSGLAVDRRGNVFVSVRDGSAGIIRKFTPAGEYADFVANLGTGAIYGLRIGPDGALYAAMATGPDQGVYRVDEGGGAERLPGTERIRFPNALAFDERGDLYVTESNSMDTPPTYGAGGIWRIPRGGEATLWLRHPLLTGIGAVLGYPLGANGIALYHGELYVTNTDKGLVLRIAIRPDGSAGDPEVWATLQEVPESPLAGSRFPVMPDDVALDAPGNLYLAVVSRNAVVRIDRENRSQHTVAVLTSATDASVQRAPFDTPASLAFGAPGGEHRNLFVTNLGWMSNLAPGPSWPGPGVVKVGAGMPGRPLP